MTNTNSPNPHYSGTLPKAMLDLAVFALVVSGTVKEGTDDYRYCTDYLTTGNKMISDARIFELLCEYHTDNAECMDRSTVGFDTILRNTEKTRFEIAISATKPFTQKHLEYVNEHFKSVTITKRFIALAADVLTMFFKKTSPSTNVSSCGAKQSIAHYMRLDRLKGIKYIYDVFARTASLLIKAKEQIPTAQLNYNDISQEYLRYIKVLSKYPYQLIAAISQKRQDYFVGYDLNAIKALYKSGRSLTEEEEKLKADFEANVSKFHNDMEVESKKVESKTDESSPDIQVDINASAAFFWNIRIKKWGRAHKKQTDFERVANNLQIVEKQLMLASALLHNVEFISMDCREYLEQICHTVATLILLDPPYIREDGKPDTTYDKPFTLEDMEELLKKTDGSDAKIIFFHYENDYVEPLLRKYGFEYHCTYRMQTELKNTVVYTKNISPNIMLFEQTDKRVKISIDPKRKAANSPKYKTKHNSASKKGGEA